MRVRLDGAAGARVAVTLAALAVGAACDGATSRSDDDRDTNGEPELGLETAASLEWLVCPGEGDCGGVRASVALRSVSCSAAIGCSDGLLHDASNVRRASLVTGFSCAFPTGDDAQDVLLGFHPRLVCYDGGDPEDPATWVPADGVTLDSVDGSHRFYSQADPERGLFYDDTARLLGPAQAHAFCLFEAWGVVAFSPDDGAPRRLMHEQHATAVEWRALIEPTADGDVSDGPAFDCHVDDASLTWVHRVTAASITHERPDVDVKGALPAEHAIVMILDDSTDGLRVVAIEDSRFPEAPAAVPEPFIERRLNTVAPAPHLGVAWTCPDLAGGRVADIAVRVEDADVHAPLGAIVVRREVTDALGPRAWDCERDAAGACVLYADEDVPVAAPCLLPIILAE